MHPSVLSTIVSVALLGSELASANGDGTHALYVNATPILDSATPAYLDTADSALGKKQSFTEMARLPQATKPVSPSTTGSLTGNDELFWLASLGSLAAVIVTKRETVVKVLAGVTRPTRAPSVSSRIAQSESADARGWRLSRFEELAADTPPLYESLDDAASYDAKVVPIQRARRYRGVATARRRTSLDDEVIDVEARIVCPPSQ